MLGKPVEEEPEAALLNQKYDGRGGRGHEAEEEDDDEQVGAGWIAVGSAGKGACQLHRLWWQAALAPLAGRWKLCCLPFPSPRARRAVSWSAQLHTRLPAAHASPAQEALRRAIEQDPSLLAQHPELQSVADRAEAEQIKAKARSLAWEGRCLWTAMGTLGVAALRHITVH